MSQLVKFGDVVEILNLTASDTQLDRYERVVGLEHIIPNELKIQNWDLMANLHDGTSFRRVFRKGHVLFGKRRANQRKVALADFDGICSSDIFVFSAKKALLAGLLPYVVQSERFFDHANPTSTESQSPRTRWQDLAKFTFELPSLDEQARIVELMTAVDEHLDALRQQLEIAKGSRAAVLHHLLSVGGDDWVNTTLGEISEISYGYTDSATSEKIGPKFLRITDVQDSKVNWESVPFCRIEDAQMVKQRLIDGDIVFARKGATTGKSFYIQNPPLAVCASYLIRLRPKYETVLPYFLNLNLQTESYWKQVERGTSGSAQGGFNASKLKSLFVNLPPIAEQERIVEIVSSMDDVIQTTEQAVAEAKVLRTTLLNQEIS